MCWDAPELACDGLPETGLLTYDLLLSTVMPPEWILVGNTPETCAPNWIPPPPVGRAYYARVRARDEADNTSDECIEGRTGESDAE